MDLEKHLKLYSKYQNQMNLISNHYSNLDEAIRRIDQIQKIEDYISVVSTIKNRWSKANSFYYAMNRPAFYNQLSAVNKTALIASHIEKIHHTRSFVEKVNLQRYSNIFFDSNIRAILNSYNNLENVNSETYDQPLPVSIETEKTQVKLNELLNLKSLITIENVLALITFLMPLHTILMIYYPNLRESERIHNLISELLAVVALLISNKPHKD